MISLKEGLLLSKSRLGVNHKLTKILRNCYLECSHRISLLSYKDYKNYNNSDCFDINKIVYELEKSVPKYFTPLPKYLHTKNSTPTPVKPVCLSRSVQYDADTIYLNKSTQSKPNDSGDIQMIKTS